MGFCTTCKHLMLNNATGAICAKVKVCSPMAGLSLWEPVEHKLPIGRGSAKETPALKATQDLINSPDHYTAGGIETIDYIKAKLSREQFIGYLTGNILKYVSRSKHKNGLEDLKKAQWYLNRLVEVVEET